MSTKEPHDPELERIVQECRAVANGFRLTHNVELTTALINYRAAQRIATAIDEAVSSFNSR